MERPVYLRQNAYQAILDSIETLNQSDLEQGLRDCGYDVAQGLERDALVEIVLEKPSRYLGCRCDILHRADLLSGLFIEFDDDELDAGHTYLIDSEGAEEIARNESTVLLRSGREGAVVTRRRIEQAFRNGCVIDYHESA